MTTITREDAERAVNLGEGGARVNGSAAGEMNGTHWRIREIAGRRARMQYKICAPGYDPKNDNGYNVITREELIARILRGPYVFRMRVPT